MQWRECGVPECGMHECGGCKCGMRQYGVREFVGVCEVWVAPPLLHPSALFAYLQGFPHTPSMWQD